MNRRTLFFHDLSDKKVLGQFISKMKADFKAGEFRINFFATGHKPEELIKSCRNGKATDPIDIIFGPSCSRDTIKGLTNFLKTKLGNLKFYFHEPKNDGAYLHIRDIMLQREIKDPFVRKNGKRQSNPKKSSSYRKAA
jgi:hypothetical protein